uniref:Uncharacterized protein n=1 Tax=Amphimedon queenslandica TaxID=400682 RepID=A0A1X7VR08_AMPQE
MKIPKKQNQKVRLNVLCRGDVLWWQEFLLAWNGFSFFPPGSLAAYDIFRLVGLLGMWNFCGAFCRMAPGSEVPHSSTGTHQGRFSQPGGLLDIESFDGEARSLFTQGLSVSSWSTYAVGKTRYLSCAQSNLNPLPPLEWTLCFFVAHLAREGLRAQSISGYLTAVCHLSIGAGYAPMPRGEWPRLAYMLKGFSKTRAAVAMSKRLLITPQLLLSLKGTWELGTVDVYSARLFWAIALTAFFGCFRIRELTQTDKSSPLRQKSGTSCLRVIRSEPGFTFGFPRLMQDGQGPI